eukprot:1142608-Pelagomonas_calceolata.AAC.2
MLIPRNVPPAKIVWAYKQTRSHPPAGACSLQDTCHPPRLPIRMPVPVPVPPGVPLPVSICLPMPPGHKSE